MNLDKLGLHSHVLPALNRLADDEYGTRNPSDVIYNALSATVFDCRNIDIQFMRDTGQAAMEEMEALKQKVRLPFPVCWFEFGGETAVLASETHIYIPNDLQADLDEHPAGDPDVIVVEILEFSGWSQPSDYLGDWDSDGPVGDFSNGFDMTYDPSGEREDGPPFFEVINGDSDDLPLEMGAEHIIGALTLLNEKLVSAIIVPDPAVQLSRARARRGRLPVSSERRILQINAPAILRAVNRTGGSHASPRLHWRRGHWRTYGRGRDAERQTWINRCLAGNPDIGMISKDYRLIWQLPMLDQAAQDK